MREKHLNRLKKLYLKQVKKFVVNWTFLIIFLISSFIFLLPFTFSGKTVRNSYLEDVNLGGLKESESKKTIELILDKFSNSEATFVLNDDIVDIKISDLGISLDTELTFNQLSFAGNSSNYFEDLILYYSAFTKKREVKPIYSLNVFKFSDFINKEFSKFEKIPVNASLAVNNGKIIVVNSQDGEIIDRAKIIEDLSARVDSLSQIPIDVQTISAFPDINTSDVNLISEKYQNLLSSRITLSWNYDSWKLLGDDLISMLVIDRSGNLDGSVLNLNIGTSSILLKNLSYEGLIIPSVEILVDDNKLDIFLEGIAKFVDRPAVNATAVFDGAKITNFTPAVDGQKLNVEKTKTQILSKISANNEENTSDIKINLPVGVTTARIANDQINSLGIKELIGKGISYFAGSIPNRIFNIELGAKRVNGTLIAPGEVFSFNNTVGEVSGKTGYKQAYVISSGRTVLDDGGGICQVSTTIFRAALNSGLPIVSRTAHAYRVGYYEQRGFGPGLDATVFSPSVDFKFKNDTQKHILVQTIFNRSNAMLEVDIYGTRDNRSVELNKPIILSRSPAPPEIRQDDPSLPKGTLKQVDFAAEGANVYFTRKVYRGGQLIYDDTFKSNFKPWQAIFLVGTGG